MRASMWRVIDTIANKVVESFGSLTKAESKLAELKQANPNGEYAISCKWYNI